MRDARVSHRRLLPMVESRHCGLRLTGGRMSTNETTGLARVPLALMRNVERRYGVGREELKRLAGFRDEELADPDARVPMSKVWSLWRAIIDRVSDRDLGLRVGEDLRARELGLLGYAVYHSATLRDALVRVARYARIVNEDLVVHVLDEGDRFGMVADREPRLVVLRHPIDCRLASIVTV